MIEKDKIKFNWIAIEAIATILLLIFAVVSLFLSNKTSNQALKTLERLSPSSAYIEFTPAYWIGNDIEDYASNIKNKNLNNYIAFNIINTGQIDSGKIVISYWGNDKNFLFEDKKIKNLPRKTSNITEIQFKVNDSSNILGYHNLLFRIYCENCLEQQKLIFKEINLKIK